MEQDGEKIGRVKLTATKGEVIEVVKEQEKSRNIAVTFCSNQCCINHKAHNCYRLRAL